MLSLAEIEGLRTFQARILYKSGLRTPEEVYQCSTQRIAQILSDNDVRARANSSSCRKLAQTSLDLVTC